MHRRKSSRTNSSANKRLRGYHIKKGLDELGDLDVNATKVLSSTKKNKCEDTTSNFNNKNKEKYNKQITKAVSNQSENEINKSLHDTHKNAVKSNTFSTLAAKAAPHEKQLYEQEELPELTQMYKSVFGKDWSEWRRVKELLFDPSALISTKLMALQVIRIWHARARKDRILPAYVESTELLMQVVLHDEQTHCRHNNDTLTKIKGKLSEFSSKDTDTTLDTAEVSGSLLRLLYGAALSRVVHVMTGSFASELHGQTYRSRARKIELPEEIVEVRQRVAHGAMPSLSELRWVCGLTLQYLYHHYWVVQEEHIRSMEQEALEQKRNAEKKKKKKKQQREKKYKNKHNNSMNDEINDAADDEKIVTNNKTEAVEENNGYRDARVSIDDIKQFLNNLESEEENEEEELKESESVVGNSADGDEETVKLEKPYEQPTQENGTDNMDALTNHVSDTKATCVINGWTISY